MGIGVQYLDLQYQRWYWIRTHSHCATCQSYYSCHHRHALSTQVSLFGVKIDLGSTSASVDMDVILVGIVCATAACYLITTTACTYPAEPIHPHLYTLRTNVGTNVGRYQRWYNFAKINNRCTYVPTPNSIGARTYQRLTQLHRCTDSVPTTGFAVINNSGAYVTLAVFAIGYVAFISLEILSEMGILLSDDISS